MYMYIAWWPYTIYIIRVLFYIPKSKGIESTCFFYNTNKDWNTLPVEAMELSQKYSFKKVVKSFLVRKTENIL
jgi:hypothetical protein